MISPAKRHLMQVRAQQESARTADSRPRPDATQYELTLAQLYEDKRRLKAIESLKAKIELKRKLLPAYQPYLDGVLAGNSGRADDVLTTLMLWCIDTGDFEQALRLGGYALKYGLQMADDYSRSLPCILAEETAEAALKQVPITLETLQAIAALVEPYDMPDQVKAKLHKALGLALESSDPAQALIELNTALSYDDHCGVKTQIKRLTKQQQETN